MHFNNRRLLEGFSFRLDKLQLKRSLVPVAEFPRVWHAMSEKQVDRLAQFSFTAPGILLSIDMAATW
ncbi:hypothetical protein [Paraburkholderia sp. BR14262]|uniref:hypothetical protein n=1 Tax=Paraburkholderia sp. BR14262 TaxID=3236999 RepID=UPI0034CD5914